MEVLPTLPPSRYIQRVRVEKLFGQFDHDLSVHQTSTIPKDPNLLILYGENGTGKTTLLWLLYHLLNREDGRGHRSYLARHRFKNISVTFSDGLEISAERDTPRPGQFVMTVRMASREIARFDYRVEADGSVKSRGQEEEQAKFLTNLPELNFGFLPHDRLSRPASEDYETRLRMMMMSERSAERIEPSSPIQESIAKAIETARQQAIRASNRGQHTVNAIYTELVRQIAQVQLTAPEASIEVGRSNLLQRLENQADLTRQYSKFGLISELQVHGLLQTLQTIPANRLFIVAQVLEPFLRGNEARFTALKPLLIALTTAVESVNSLYLNKRIVLHLEKGLQIATLSGEHLLPDHLSSGEQELLILFCEVISALGPNTILFIDEPELSLNVSWQKNLLDALLKCASGSNVQFVIATHSIELLARHRSNVARLSNAITGQLEPATKEQRADG